MSVHIVNAQILRTWEDTINILPDGSAEASVKYKVPWANVFAYVPNSLAPHPDFPALLYYDGDVQHEEGGMAALVLRYRGIFASNPSLFEQVDGVISTTAEPIETCPLFSGPPGTDPDKAPVSRKDISTVNNYFATGSSSAPSTIDATLSGDAAITYFGKKLKGVDSYYRTGFTWRRHYATYQVPDYTQYVGYIVTPPTSGVSQAPNPPPGQNYLFSGISWRQQGGVVTVDEEYQLSGPGGWDVDLYTYPGK